jgi:hypothetical protein
VNANYAMFTYVNGQYQANTSDTRYGTRLGSPTSNGGSNANFAVSMNGQVNASNTNSNGNNQTIGNAPSNGINCRFSQMVFDVNGNLAQAVACWSLGPLFTVFGQNVIGQWPISIQLDTNLSF